MRVRTIDYKPDRKLKTDTRSENNIYTVLVEFVEHALVFKEIAEHRKNVRARIHQCELEQSRSVLQRYSEPTERIWARREIKYYILL